MLFGILAGSASILVTWLILIIALVGIGAMVRRAFGLALTTEGLFTSFWFGLLLTILLLQLWHLVLPIRAAALAVVLGAGAVGLAINRAQLRTWAAHARGRLTPILLVVLVLAAFWMANRSMDTVAAGDTGMYHIPSVIWAKEYPVVPGLANLHGRLGFNGSGLLFAAMVDVGPWANRATHLVNGLFLVVLLGYIIYRVQGYFRAGARPAGTSVFDLLLLTPVVIVAIDPWYVSSFTTDLPTAVVLFVATSRLLRLMNAGAARDPRDDTFELLLITGLCTVAVCFKLSAAIFAGLLWLIAVAWFVRTYRGQRPWFARALAWTVILSAGLGVVWAVRGTILSGYPFYPSTAVAAPVEWRVPEEQALAEADWIGHFARTFYSGRVYNGSDYGDMLLSDWTWFRPWLSGALALANVRWLLVLPLGLALVFFLAAALARARGTRFRGVGLLLIPTLAGMVFWFVAGPRPPFGFFAFWVLASLAAVMAFGGMVESAVPGRVRLVGSLAIALGAMPVLVPMGQIALSPQRSLRNLARVGFVPAGSDRWLQPPPGPSDVLGQRELQTFETESGLKLFVPVQTNRCWFAPPLCTPHPAANLRLRKPGHPESGFVTHGAWRAERWPSPQTRFLETWRAYHEGRTVTRRPHADSVP